MATPENRQGDGGNLNPSVEVRTWIPREVADWLDLMARATLTTRSRLLRNMATKAWAEAEGRITIVH